jgi:aminoglycoside 2''-phosphotransferase
MGCPRLVGKPLIKPKSIHDRVARERIAGQLAGFLRRLHAISIDSLGIKLQSADAVEDWANMYAGIQENLFPAMRPDARAQVASHFEAYLGDPARQTFPPALRHDDFGGSNILYDPRRKRVTGVLDFSFCALGDPAADLASASTLGEGIFALIAPLYEPDERKRDLLLARACFYRGTFALAEALDGFHHHDRRAYETGMEKYI